MMFRVGNGMLIVQFFVVLHLPHPFFDVLLIIFIIVKLRVHLLRVYALDNFFNVIFFDMV